MIKLSACMQVVESIADMLLDDVLRQSAAGITMALWHI